MYAAFKKETVVILILVFGTSKNILQKECLMRHDIWENMFELQFKLNSNQK